MKQEIHSIDMQARIWCGGIFTFFFVGLFAKDGSGGGSQIQKNGDDGDRDSSAVVDSITKTPEKNEKEKIQTICKI